MTATAPLSTITEVPLTDIHISELNVRLSTPTKDLEELAASIKLHGLLQPVVLAGELGAPPYQLISGQRRFLAHERILKTPTIRAVFTGNLNRVEIIIRSLVENLQRAELDFQDTSKAVTALYRELGDEYKVSANTGLSVRRIREHLMIHERASPKMKALLGAGQVTPADVKRALQAAKDDIAKAEKLLELMVKIAPTSHQKRRLVSYGEQRPSASAEELLEEAMKPHVERKLVISLTDQTRTALEQATKVKEMDAPDLAEQIISEWLAKEGFSNG